MILFAKCKATEELYQTLFAQMDVHVEAMDYIKKLRIEEDIEEKAEKMKAVYDFVRSVDRLVCYCLGREDLTITEGLESKEIQWAEVKALLNLEDSSSEGLLTTISKLKKERIDHGYPTPATANNLVISTDILGLASENFSLIPSEIHILRKLTDWVAKELPELITLADLYHASGNVWRPEEVLWSDL
ncbi:hypothetical protein PSHT_01948 [Puccinia striiformis]|uniref:Uncharacterized protein n=1 Tax=Puccinia striiformis TaxID=27350 RepID=A0A2S4WJ78_9BASI|nr:hypothetical protein PSHT_01948 [Puccinia striiformis]